MRLFTRAHEWAADHFSFVQYPHIRAGYGRFQGRTLSAGERAALGVVGALLIAVASFALFAGGLVLWALITA
jgi:hypothetical protein